MKHAVAGAVLEAVNANVESMVWCRLLRVGCADRVGRGDLRGPVRDALRQEDRACGNAVVGPEAEWVPLCPSR